MRLKIVLITLLLAACAAPTPPAAPLPWREPPSLLSDEDAYVVHTAVAVVAMSPPELRAFLAREGSLIAYMEPVGSLAPPAASDPLEGDWPEAGARRRLTLADGHQLLERSHKNETRDFRYQAFGFTNAAGRGVDHIYADWTLTEVPDGTHFEWTYRLVPKNPIARVFVRRFRDRELAPFMQGTLDRMAVAARGAQDDADRPPVTRGERSSRRGRGPRSGRRRPRAARGSRRGALRPRGRRARASPRGAGRPPHLG